MKKISRPLAIASILVMLSLWAFVFLVRGSNVLQGLDLLVFILIVVLGAIALINAYRKDKEIKAGFPEDDELSLIIKYKAGYNAFLASMYMWLFIFIFQRYFPNTESMLGSGVLLSGLIFYISKLLVKKEYSENQD